LARVPEECRASPVAARALAAATRVSTSSGAPCNSRSARGSASPGRWTASRHCTSPRAAAAFLGASALYLGLSLSFPLGTPARPGPGFFPVAVGTLKGLTSTPPASLELMDSYAASWRQTLFKLRFPAALPYIVPALKLAATASVVGVVVAEISTGLAGGIGRLIIEYAREATSDPAKVFTAVFGAAALGLVMAAIVAIVDLVGMRNRPREATE